MKRILVRSSKFIVRSTAVFLLFLLLPTTNSVLTTVYAQQATLSLSPSSGTFNKGCNFSLDVILNTGGAQTDGTDAIILYDATRFNAKTITAGTIYPDYPGNNIDSQTGKITISGLASVSSSYSGTGTLASIAFQVLDSAPTGASQIKFDFDPNNKAKTTDSNVVQRGTVADILNSVVNGNYTVGAGNCATATPAPGVAPRGAVGTPSATPTTIDNIVDEEGKGPGTLELTYTMAIVGSVLVVLGILGLALL